MLGADKDFEDYGHGNSPTFATETSDEAPNAYLLLVKTVRPLIYAVVALAGCLILAVGGYHLLIPLKSVEAVYIALDEDSDSYVYKLYPMKDLKGRQNVAKYFLRNWLEARCTIDRVTEPARLKQVMAMSSEEVWEEFRNEMSDPRNGLYHKKGFKREVRILRDAPVVQNSRYKVHEIDFVTIDTNDKRPGESEAIEWNAKLAYVFSPMEVQLEQDGSMVNPAGLQILECTINKRRRL